MAGKSHRRSRNGCMVCRRRKIKCDEGLPSCQRCITSHQICDGPNRYRYSFAHECRASGPPPSPLWAPFQPPALIGLSHSESCLFEFFLYKTSHSLADFHDHRLWSVLVPQACHSSLMIRHIVFAISSLHRRHPSATRGGHVRTTSGSQIEALQWCIQSLEALRSGLTDGSNRSHEIVLLSCILLSALQFQENDVLYAVPLLLAGFKFACEVASRQSYMSTELDMLVRTVLRQGVLLSIFGCTISREQIRICWQHIVESCTKMYDLPSARDCLFACMLDAITFINSVEGVRYKSDADHCEEVVQAYANQQEDVLKSLARWYRQFLSLTTKLSGSMTIEDQGAISSMMMYYHVSRIWSIACLARSSLVLDQITQQFDDILVHAENVLLIASPNEEQVSKFELGVISPLSFVAGHCRHPLLRRKAIKMIRKASMREALFTAEHSARAAELPVRLEETSRMRHDVGADVGCPTTQEGLQVRLIVNRSTRDASTTRCMAN